jgi:hypothetical protein
MVMVIVSLVVQLLANAAQDLLAGRLQPIGSSDTQLGTTQIATLHSTSGSYDEPSKAS